MIDAQFLIGLVLKEGTCATSVEKTVNTLQCGSCKMNDASVHVSIDLAMQYLREGKVQECIEYAEKALDANPDDARCFSVLGAAYTNLGDLEAAISSFRRALELAPSARSHYNLGTAYKTAGQVQEAEEQFRIAVELDQAYQLAVEALKQIQAESTPVEPVATTQIPTEPTVGTAPPPVQEPPAPPEPSSLLQAEEVKYLEKERKIREVHRQMTIAGLLYGIVVGPIGLMGAMFVFRFFMAVPLGLLATLIVGVIFGAIVGFWTGYTSGDDMTGARNGALVGAIAQGGAGLAQISDMGIGYVIILAVFGAITGGAAGYFVGTMVENSIGWN